MRITKEQLKQIIKEEASIVLNESAYSDMAARYNRFLTPSTSLRFGRGITSPKDVEKTIDYPSWAEVGKALSLIKKELDLIPEESKITEIVKKLVEIFISKNQGMWNSSDPELSEVILRGLQDLWESVWKLSRQIEKIPNYHEHQHLTKLVDFIKKVSGTRMESISLGFNLEDIDPADIPQFPQKA